MRRCIDGGDRNMNVNDVVCCIANVVAITEMNHE